MFYSLTGSSISGKNLAMDFSLFFLDRQLQDETNETDVLSDQLLIAQDIFAMFNYPKFDWEIDQDVTIDFFTENEKDYLAGVKFDITLNYPMLNDRCQVPSSFSYPEYVASLSSNGGAVNYVKFLLDYPSFATLPANGDSSKIYVTNDNNKLYRWADNAWIEISPTTSTSWGNIGGTLSNQTDLQNALNAKAPLASPTFTGTVSGITKSMVGLENVDNTTDLLKPISTATQTALNLKYDATNPSGYTTNVGTVTSVGALTLGTSGTDVSSTVATGTTTPAITLNIPTASATNRGALSSTDWTTFNNKANALSGTTNTLAKFSSSSAIGNSNITDTGSLISLGSNTAINGFINLVGSKILEPQIASSYTQLLIQPNSGNKDAVFMFAPSGTSTTSVMEFYSNSSLTSATRHIFKNLNGLLKIGADTALLPVSFITNGSEIARFSATNGNLLLNTTADAGYKLDVNGTFRQTGSTTASSAIARGSFISPTLVASANSDVLVGLDINPTFTNGAFTGVLNYGLRVNGKIFAGGGFLELGRNANSGSANQTILYADAFETTLMNNVTGARIAFRVNGTDYGRFLPSGNFTLQNGGTFTDAGFRLDVAGTTRFQGTTASDSAPLGSELAGVTGTGTNWTLAGTNLNVGGYSHTVGDVTPLTTSLAAVNGTYYQIAYTITGRTAGSITIAYGGTSTSVSATGATGPLASSTAVLTITPTTDFNGTVVLSIKSISTSSASSTFANSSGTSNIEVRANSSQNNTFIGINAGRRVTTGNLNAFFGTNSGANNTTGNNNTFIGIGTGTNNTTGSNNCFLGLNAGVVNTIGGQNTFIGQAAGTSNTTGGFNTFIGQGAGQNNISVSNNTFIGYQSGFNNAGDANAFVGYFSGLSNTSGRLNTFVGYGAGRNNTTGAANVILGQDAARFIANGSTANTITNNSIFIGNNTKALADNQTNQIVIGEASTGLGSNTTVLGNGNTVTTAIYGDLLLGGTTPITSALLAMTSTTEGFLPPRMTTTQKNAIATPATGLVVFDTTLGKLCVFSTTWQTITSV
jgi:hypothetical protein